MPATAKPSVAHHVARNFVAKVSLSDARATPHLHAGLEIGTVTSGSVIMYYRDERFALRVGDSYFVDPLLPHSHSGHPSANLIYVQFDSDLVVRMSGGERQPHLLTPFRRTRSGLPPVVHAHTRLHSIIRAIHTQSVNPGLHAQVNARIMLFSALIALYDCTTRDSQHIAQNAPGNHLVETALRYVDEHALEPLSTRDVAAHCHVSVSRLSHVFRDAMNTTVLRYRDQIRVAAAVGLLSDSTHKVAIVAKRCGFENQTQFYRLFRRLSGQSPADLRPHR